MLEALVAISVSFDDILVELVDMLEALVAISVSFNDILVELVDMLEALVAMSVSLLDMLVELVDMLEALLAISVSFNDMLVELVDMLEVLLVIFVITSTPSTVILSKVTESDVPTDCPIDISLPFVICTPVPAVSFSWMSITAFPPIPLCRSHQ